MTRVAVIGAGAWGRNLVKNFVQLGVLEAVVDPDPERLDAIRAEHDKLRLETELDAVLDGSVQALAIASPAPCHFAQARSALEAGLDVYVEKPLAMSTAEAEQLVALAEARNGLLMAGHLLLYQPAIQWIRDFMREGGLGQLYGLRHERLGLGRARSVENVLWDSGVHDIAVLLHLTGESPSIVRASGHRLVRPTVEDDVHVHLEFPSGVRANLQTSWLWPESQRRLIIRGSKGMLVYDELDQTVTLHRKGITPDLHHWDEGSAVVFTGHGQPLRLQLEHFLARIADRQAPLSDGASAIPVLRVLELVSHMLRSNA